MLGNAILHAKEIAALIDEAERAAPVRRRAWAWSAIALCSLVLAAGAHLTLSTAQKIYITGIGERRVIVPPDRSRVTLNTASQIRVKFERGVRAIALERGEARAVQPIKFLGQATSRW